MVEASWPKTTKARPTTTALIKKRHACSGHVCSGKGESQQA